MARKRINMKKIREIIRFSETTDMVELNRWATDLLFCTKVIPGRRE